MSTVALTQRSFHNTVNKPGIVLVDWWATWCGPCRMFAPVFERASERHTDITFGKVDTDAEQGLASRYSIQSIPTLMVFRDGILLFEQAGMLPASALDQLIQKVRDLDMAKVRESLARQQGAAANA